MTLGLRARFQIATTILFIVVGGLMLVRTAVCHGPMQAYVVGASFVAFGVYRARFIVRALRRRETSP